MNRSGSVGSNKDLANILILSAFIFCSNLSGYICVYIDYIYSILQIPKSDYRYLYICKLMYKCSTSGLVVAAVGYL